MYRDSANSAEGRGLPAVGWMPPASGVWGRGPSDLQQRQGGNKDTQNMEGSGFHEGKHATHFMLTFSAYHTLCTPTWKAIATYLR